MSQSGEQTQIDKTATIGEGVRIADYVKVEADVSIGDTSSLWDFVHIRQGAHIGNGVILGRGVQIDSKVSIGAGVKIQNGVSVYNGVTIEDDVFIGPFAVFTNDLHPRAFIDNWQITPTLVKKGASIGANATIVCGNEIGEYAMIAAGSVVTKPVRPYELVAGVPARHLGWVNKKCEVVSRSDDCPDNIETL